MEKNFKKNTNKKIRKIKLNDFRNEKEKNCNKKLIITLCITKITNL